jgi:prepilin-type N-terminal cleavage/methylation domain-containing protein
MKKKFNKTGFTLIEAIITILILAILATIAAPRFTHMIENQRAATASMTLRNVFQSQRRYFIDHDAFTSAPGDLDVDFTAPEGFSFTVLNIDDNRIAGLQRDPSPDYTLFINSAGEIWCDGAFCPNISTGMLGQ